VPVVLYMPTLATAYRKVIKYEDALLATVMAQSADMQRQYIVRLCSELGIFVVDLTPPFQSAAEVLKGDDLLFFLYDFHRARRGTV